MVHIEDKEFIRGKVPMTKQEVRCISIAKLDLKEDSVLIDVGAGSGSVGIEAANFAPKGKVFGIEVNPDGIEVIQQNLVKFNVLNYELIEGLAPSEIPDICVDRMFIGGSKGNLETILEWFLGHSREGAKVVIGLEQLKFCEIEVVNINIARNKKIGRYNMMMGENPIYIISAKRSK